jgi:hypothetical protein
MDVLFLRAYASARICLSTRCLANGLLRHNTMEERKLQPVTYRTPILRASSTLSIYYSDRFMMARSADLQITFMKVSFVIGRVLELIKDISQSLTNGASKFAQHL